MPRPLLWLVVALLGATTSACATRDEKACRQLEALWQRETTGAPEGKMGKTAQGCLEKLDRFIPGKKDCVVRCYELATSLDNVFDCDRKCGL